MNNWEKITTVLKKPEVYGDISGIPVKYVPLFKGIYFEASQTGTRREQAFGTEYDKNYFPVLYDGCAYLVSTETTTKALKLEGMDGYKNSTVILRKCARLFSNKTIMAEGVILDEETIGAFKKFKKEQTLKQAPPCWTAIKGCEIERGETYIEKYGLYQITDNGKRHAILYNHGGRYGAKAKNVGGVIRPVIRLHSDTYVNLDMEEGKKLEIKLVLE